MDRRRALAALTAACALLAVTLGALTGWRAPGWWAVPVLTGAGALGELVTVPFVAGRQRWRLAVPHTLSALALVVAPGGWLVLAAAAATAFATQVRHLPRRHAGFETARTAAATALGAGAALLIRGGLGDIAGGGGTHSAAIGTHAVAALVGGTGGAAVSVALAHVLACAAAAVTARRSLWRLLRAGASPGLLQPLASAVGGLLTGWLGEAAPLGLVALLAPVVLIWSAYHQQRRRDAEIALYAELVRSQELVSGRSVDVAAQVVLTALARLLGGADVELLLRHPTGPVRYLGDEYGVHSRTAVDGTAFDADWALHALGADRVVSGVAADRPYVAATVGAAGAIAVLGAWRPAGSPPFGRDDLLGVDALVAQAAAWLAVRELTDPGEDLAALGTTARPAMNALRESAHRLSRLTQRLDGTDPVGSIVEELYVTERAVAALLGAAPPASAVPASRGAAAEDWTTTGTLG